MAKRDWKIMKVDSDFKKWAEKIAKENKISQKEATKIALDSMNMMKGNKKIKKRIEEELSF